MLSSILISIILLISFSHAGMTCEPGYKSLYVKTLGGYNVLCCAEGISGQHCSPSSKYDYAGGCASMFQLMPENGFTCNCGNECSGKVIINNLREIVCEGSCTCSNNFGCNETLPPSQRRISQTIVHQPTTPTSSSSNLQISLLVLLSLCLMLFC